MSETGTILTLGLIFCAFYFEVFLLLSFLDKQFGKRSKRAFSIDSLPAGPLPEVCIVVPCFNEEKTVANSIESLLALSYPKEKLQILVVDDGSKDKTYEKALTYGSDQRVTVLRKENGGKHTALNLALEHTTAPFIGCLDADSAVDSQALMRIVAAFRDPKVAAVTPGINVRAPRTILQHIQYVEYLLGIFNRYVFASLGSIFITPGPFSIFRASVIREVGGWKHGHSTEDMELGLRLQATGWKIANDPHAIVRTTTPATLRALVRQRTRWSYGFVKNVFDYRYMIGNKKYGNLGLFILPVAILSFAAALFFASRIIWTLADSIFETVTRLSIVGLSPWHTPEPLFFFNTSVMWLIVYLLILLTIVLISFGSFLSSGKRLPPLSTPLFLFIYGFIAPIWLGIALGRAVFGRSVRWR